MRLILRNAILHVVLALLFGFGIGLAYAWFISPVEYVDASPAILRADFKDQYRIVIAASYASTHDLARARARLEILGDADPLGALSAQTQRMLSAGESTERTQSLVQFVSDLKAGVVSIPLTSTPPPTASVTPTIEAPAFTETIMPTITAIETTEQIYTPTAEPADSEKTPLPPPPIFTATPQKTTPTPEVVAPVVITPFNLSEKETVCDPDIQAGLLQFMLIDSNRKQIAGIKITVTSVEGEDFFFTGFKPELGAGYADFVMQAETSYSARVAEGGAFIASISAPACTDASGKPYLGGWRLTFQRQ